MRLGPRRRRRRGPAAQATVADWPSGGYRTGGDSVFGGEPRVRSGRGYAHVRCPRAPASRTTLASLFDDAGDYEDARSLLEGAPLARLESVEGFPALPVLVSRSL